MIQRDEYQTVRQHPAFASLKLEDYDKLAVHIRSREVPKGQILFFSGDHRDRIFLILQGHVRIEQFDADDQYTYIDYVKQGSLFPYGGMFRDRHYHYTATTLTTVRYLTIPVELYEHFVQNCPEQLLFITKRLSDILEFQELRLRNVMTISARDRVIQSLAILCKDYQYFSETIPFPLSLQEIAKLAATTRETVYQVLKYLSQQGKILYEKKHLTFLDRDYFLKSFEEIS